MELKDVTQGRLVAMGGPYSNVLTDVGVSRRAAVRTVTINPRPQCMTTHMTD